MEEDNILCIYHGNCADGFGAAWAVWKRFPNAEFHADVYGEEPPETKGKRVILVDFCYKPEVLKKMAKHAQSMLILDHHKSAVEEVKAYDDHPFVHMADDYTGQIDWQRHLHNTYQDDCENANINGAVIYTLFDMERSGAMIAYEFFHPGKRVPQLIRHIQDRDLWKFELEYTREIQAALFSYPYEFEVWDNLFSNADTIYRLQNDGIAIERKHFKDIAELIKVTRRQIIIGGYQVWCANLPYTMASDACHAMCDMSLTESGQELGTRPAFSACYYDKPEGRVFSLRSIGDFDVSEIAIGYGGGGHKNAAGFMMPIGWNGDGEA